MDALERDALEVLCLVRTVKNSFAPISRIPPEVLSLIPDFFDEENKDGDLIASTHVCRDWRDVLTSRPSLWTQPDFKNIDKTRAYIQRSQSSPLKLYLGDSKVTNDAFTLVIPHIRRLKSLTIHANALPSVLRHFRCHAPLLEKFDMYISRITQPILDGALFDGDFSSLRELRLRRVITDFPWKNLANLQVVEIRSYSHAYGMVQLLNFFESAPLLHTVTLEYSRLDTSDAPPERMVPLRHLKVFDINTNSSNLILLHRLHIPAGASLISKFELYGDESSLLDYLPERSPNFSNLSHITTINLLFHGCQNFVRLSGPSGSLRVLAERISHYLSSSFILPSFGPSILSTTQRLTISRYTHSGPHCAILQTLSFMDHLRTLTLIECDEQPFTLSLDPEQRSSVLCSNMEELILYAKPWGEGLNVECLIRMAKNRASRGAKLSSITIVSRYGLPQGRNLFELRKYVTRLDYRVDETRPAWDDIPCGSE